MTMPEDPFDLHRFVAAQQPVYGQALKELRAGAKRSHWMWFIFPQIAGLGASEMARRYAIGSLGEARAFLAHAVLGPRLRACTEAVLAHRDRPVSQVFGYPDDLKFHSSMTLFHLAAPADPLLAGALQQLCAGVLDQKTVARCR